MSKKPHRHDDKHEPAQTRPGSKADIEQFEHEIAEDREHEQMQREREDIDQREERGEQIDPRLESVSPVVGQDETRQRNEAALAPQSDIRDVVQAHLDNLLTNGLGPRPLGVNETVIYPQITAGIARVMQTEAVAPQAAPAALTPPATPQGGGDLNGTQSTTIMLGQAGTAGVRIAVPHQISGSGGAGTGIV